MSAAPRVLFVCLGNICRSPTAEAVVRRRAHDAGVAIEVDSAGTGGGHVGDPPDPRAVAHGARRGYDLSALRARQVTCEDFLEWDALLAMDASNLDALAPLRPGWDRRAVTPQLALDYAPGADAREVPDPYYGGEAGFDLVLDLLEAMSDGLIAAVKAGRGPGAR